jgi:hypothetical protein
MRKSCSTVVLQWQVLHVLEGIYGEEWGVLIYDSEHEPNARIVATWPTWNRATTREMYSNPAYWGTGLKRGRIWTINCTPAVTISSTPFQEQLNWKKKKLYVVGQYSSWTRHRVLALAAVHRNLSMVWWRWHISVSQLCCWSIGSLFF